MSFRQRVMLLTALAIAVTVTASSVAVWVIAKHQLFSQLDQSVSIQAATSPGGGPFFGGSTRLTATVRPDGDSTNPAIPITKRAQAVAAGTEGDYFVSTEIQGRQWREGVFKIPGGAIVSIQPLWPTLHSLHRLRLWILLIGGAGIALAAALAGAVATAALRPVRRLTLAAENVAATGNLAERVDVRGDDELARLATRFNAMLAALEESVGRQRRLVADASHELRTPLTAARTNVDLLQEGKLPEDEARRALAEAASELNSLTSLVADLVELARGEERKLRIEEVHLDDLVAESVERARSRAPEATFVTSFSPTLVKADPVLLERAVGNLLDNAVKYSPVGAPIEVTVRDGEVVVADHGPGVAEEDLPRVFDRFYRSAGARSKPGAGLGLAIVREAAEAHGGKASVETSSSGAKFRISLPATA